MPSSIHILSIDTRTASTKGRPPCIYEGLPFVSHAPSRTRDIAGFTLVEMIVSLAVFSIVAVVALSALVKIVSANKKAQSLQSSISNLNFVLDAMSRDLITGSRYHCEANNGSVNYEGSTINNNNCPSGLVVSHGNGNISGTLAFRSSKVLTTGVGSPCPAAYAYRFRGKIDGTYALEKAAQSVCGIPIGDSTFVEILDPSVTITGYALAVPQVNSSRPYPYAMVRISGYTGIRERDKTYFDVQTTASVRTINN